MQTGAAMPTESLVLGATSGEPRRASLWSGPTGGSAAAAPPPPATPSATPRGRPRPVPPRLEGVLVQPAPHGADAHLLHQPAGDSLLAHVSDAEAAQRDRPQRGQLTGDRLDLSDDRRRERPAAAPAGPGQPAPPDPPGRALAPLGRGVRRDARALAICLFCLPCAAASTTCARSTSRCSAVRRRTRASSTRRSSAVSTT
jgi:hypothetical protein